MPEDKDNNLKHLLKDMEKHYYPILAISFTVHLSSKPFQVILAKLNKQQKDSPYASVLLVFSDQAGHLFSCQANSSEIILNGQTKVWAHFFKIPITKDKNFSVQLFKSKIIAFNHSLSKQIPRTPTITPEKSVDIMKVVARLFKDDPNKCFPMRLTKNADRVTRTPLNNEKARLLCPSLYQRYLLSHKNVSVAFSTKASEQRTDDQLLEKFQRY